MECESIHEPTSFSNNFIDFYSCEVVLSSDAIKNEAENFVSIIA